MTNIIIPLPITDEEQSLLLFSEQIQKDDPVYRFIPSDAAPNLEQTQEGLKVLLGDEKILKVKYYNKYVENKASFVQLCIDSFKEKHGQDLVFKTLIEDIKLKMQEIKKESYQSPNTFSGEFRLDFAKKALQLSIVYKLMENKTEVLIENETVKDEIEDAILDVREANKEIKTEMDILDDAIAKSLEPGKQFKVLSCAYNGEEMSTEDLVYKLRSHTLPQYITQIDIRTTLEDEYQIITDFGKITRSKGGKIQIERREEEPSKNS